MYRYAISYSSEHGYYINVDKSLKGITKQQLFSKMRNKHEIGKIYVRRNRIVCLASNVNVKPRSVVS